MVTPRDASGYVDEAPLLAPEPDEELPEPESLLVELGPPESDFDPLSFEPPSFDPPSFDPPSFDPLSFDPASDESPSFGFGTSDPLPEPVRASVL